MILAIYQTPSSGIPEVPGLDSAPASAFIGRHSGPMPAAGGFFLRYARTWQICAVFPQSGDFTFRCTAFPVPIDQESA